MRGLLRQAFLLTLAAALSWWVLLRVPSHPARARRPAEPVLLVSVRPEMDQPAPETTEAESPASPIAAREHEAHEHDVETEVPDPYTLPPSTAVEESDAGLGESPPEEPFPDAEEAPPSPEGPPPAELGAPEGKELAEPVAASPDPVEHGVDPKGDEIETTAAQLMGDAALLSQAADELAGQTRRGFATVLLASPEEQLDIARFFGEELVLVPQRALDPDAEQAAFFRLETGPPARVTSVRGPLHLDRYRQYRDLFDYEYSRLPGPVRELRRAVLARSEVYIFAALIPAAELAVVMGRRRDALRETTYELSDVRRFTLRYVRGPGGEYDIRVEDIAFADGTHYLPDGPSRGGRSP